MSGFVEAVIEIAWRTLRVAAAVFMLGFMVGDLFFPQYFCEEYIVYPSGGLVTVASAASPAPDTVDASGAASASGDQVGAARLSPTEPGAGDYCLHIIHRPVFSAAAAELKRPPADTARALIPPSVDPNSLYHPPRSL